MSSFYAEDLAHIHDEGFGELAREAAGFVRAELAARGLAGGLVVDLGCGSGILAAELAGAHPVLGVDQSEAFLTLARRRAPRARFERGSLFRCALPACAAISAIGECVNYLFDEPASDGPPRVDSSDPAARSAALDALFARVHGALLPGGFFVFDAAEPGRVPGGGPTQGHVESADWAVLVTREEDRAARLLTRRITTFRKLGAHYRRGQELHRLRLWPRAELLERLTRAGFETRAVDGYGALVFGAGHAGFVATKGA